MPYRANRVVIFNSDLFHETDVIAFQEGYRNRRINVTMLFGRRVADGSGSAGNFFQAAATRDRPEAADGDHHHHHRPADEQRHPQGAAGSQEETDQKPGQAALTRLQL